MSENYVLLTREVAEEFEPFVGDGIEINFLRLDSNGIKQLVEGPIWAFLDWVTDDISGLEMCRRLRADPLTRVPLNRFERGPLVLDVASIIPCHSH